MHSKLEKIQGQDTCLIRNNPRSGNRRVFLEDVEENYLFSQANEGCEEILLVTLGDLFIQVSKQNFDCVTCSILRVTGAQ